jgi:hypothetical protein
MEICGLRYFEKCSMLVLYDLCGQMDRMLSILVQRDQGTVTLVRSIVVLKGEMTISIRIGILGYQDPSS